MRAAHGRATYPGSPLIAGYFLRKTDSAHLAELHPAEYAGLTWVASFATLHHEDGFRMAQSLCPPMPRRGFMLIDPSYEVKSEYEAIPRQISQLARKWNVGTIALWYPILTDNRHAGMLAALGAEQPRALKSEIRFPPLRDGHNMVGSGMFIINPPWGLDREAKRLEDIMMHTLRR